MNAVWSAELPISVHQKMILLKMADNAQDNGECWPSQELLAKTCQMSKRTVVRCVAGLEAAGLIKVKRTRVSNKITRNHYWLNMKAIISSDNLSPSDLASSDTESLCLNNQVTATTHQSDSYDTLVVTQCHPNHP